jgi:DNA (cytosine-5)-methyltransferase 1
VINKEISNKNLKGIFLRIKDNLKYFKKRNVDIILGGPPCQAYSVASWKKRNEKRKKISNRDQRKYLYKLYGQFLKKFKPKIFVFENVPGLYTADDGLYYKNMKKYFKSLGYEMDDRELDASNFGVIQRRRRIIVIGWKKRLEFKYPEFRIIKNRWKVEHIFSDMPKLKAGDEINCSNYTKKISNKYLMKYEIRNGLGFIPQNITRPLNKSDKKIYKLAIKKMEKGERLKNDKIPDEMRTINNIDSFLDRFKVVDKSNISHTLIAHIAKDGHHYIHPDKKQLRSISIREAARIQSFSDDHFFEGSRTSAFRQIGNAVPPIMARHIAKYIKRNINC